MLISALNAKSHYDSGYRLYCVIYQPSVVELLRDLMFKLIKSNHLNPLHFLSSFPFIIPKLFLVGFLTQTFNSLGMKESAPSLPLAMKQTAKQPNKRATQL